MAKIKFFISLIRDTSKAWDKDNGLMLAGALSFFTTLSILPILMILVAMTGAIFGPEQAQAEIVKNAALLINPEFGQIIENILGTVTQPGRGVFSLISGAFLIFISLRGFTALCHAFDIIFEADKLGKIRIWRAIRGRLLSGVILIGLGMLLVTVSLFDIGLKTLSNYMNQNFPGMVDIRGWGLLSSVSVIVFFMLTCAVVYKTIPPLKMSWSDVGLGSFLATTVFFMGKWVMVHFLKISTFNSVYGASGSLVIFLLWIYFSSSVFLLGAEFTWIYAHKRNLR